ncbi:MAG: hypothetical protein OHK0052_13790 [Anaerolineales bacterium]
MNLKNIPQSIDDEDLSRRELGRTPQRAQPAPKAEPQPAAPKIIAQHTVALNETLSHLALKYYGSAIKEKWMLIYEANKDIIGDNPNILRIGQVLNIPEP